MEWLLCASVRVDRVDRLAVRLFSAGREFGRALEELVRMSCIGDRRTVRSRDRKTGKKEANELCIRDADGAKTRELHFHSFSLHLGLRSALLHLPAEWLLRVAWPIGAAAAFVNCESRADKFSCIAKGENCCEKSQRNKSADKNSKVNCPLRTEQPRRRRRENNLFIISERANELTREAEANLHLGKQAETEAEAETETETESATKLERI